MSSIKDKTGLSPLFLKEEDPQRPEIEATLADMSEEALRALYWETRRAAKQARLLKDMETLFGHVRGTKTIQRIAGARGILISAHPQASSSDTDRAS